MRPLKFKLKTVILFFVLIATLASSVSIYLTIEKFHNVPFPWDSAARACEGLKIAQDLRSGDIISFLGDTYKQGWWPFFHSWLLAPAFILFGNTYAVARSVSLFCFILFLPIIYWIGIEMSKERGHWVGLIPACLVLMSLPFLVLSAMCMSEIPGLLMTFLTFLIYLKAIKHQNSFLFFCTSILLALTLFTKWHHGVFVITAVFLSHFTSNKKILTRRNCYLFFPFFALMLGWFIYPRHIMSFFGHSTFQPHFYKLLSLENLLYYPKSFIKMYHSSTIFAVIIAISFIYSLRKIKNPKIRLFVIHVFIGLLIMTIKLDNRHRYIITIVPSVWILGAIQVVELIDLFKHRLYNKKIKAALATSVIVGILIICFISVLSIYEAYPGALLKLNYASDEKLNKAYVFISEKVHNHKQIAVFGSWDYDWSLMSSTIRWHIEIRKDNDKIERRDKKKKAYAYFWQFLKNRDRRSYNNFINFLENKDVKVEEYHLLSFMKILDREAFQNYRKEKNINPFSDKIIDVNFIPGPISCLITICREEEIGLNFFAEQFLSGQEEWKKIVRKKFDELGITITIYERKIA